jgi:4-hydroxybenzoate polyprenyltransferase
MFQQLKHFLEMIRFSHTLFALPFALLAAVMAWVAPAAQAPQFSWRELAGLLVAMVGARSAAMAFNRLVDRDVDALNPRTARRHLPAGVLSVSAVRGFLALSVGIYLLGAALFWPNYLPLLLALPVLAVLLGYSYAKRFTSLSQFWLGLALGLAPVCAWIAIRGSEVLARPTDLLPAGLLGLAVLFWVAGFDTLYACQDYEFDRQAGLRSIPTAFGLPGALRLAAVCHALTVVFLALLPLTYLVAGPDLGLDWIWGLGVAAIAGLLVYEHRLVRADDLSRVNQAFFQVNVVISLGLLVVGLLDLTVL